MSEEPSIERLPVGEAAAALGVTRDAIHKRIRRGTIEYDTGEDGRLYVYIDTSTSNAGEYTGKSKNKSESEPSEFLERLISSQEAQLDYLRDQLQQERDANRENRRIIAGLTQRIPQLEAPAPTDEPQEGETGAEASERGDDHVPPGPRPSLWRRIFETRGTGGDR